MDEFVEAPAAPPPAPADEDFFAAAPAPVEAATESFEEAAPAPMPPSASQGSAMDEGIINSAPQSLPSDPDVFAAAPAPEPQAAEDDFFQAPPPAAAPLAAETFAVSENTAAWKAEAAAAIADKSAAEKRELQSIREEAQAERDLMYSQREKQLTAAQERGQRTLLEWARKHMPDAATRATAQRGRPPDYKLHFGDWKGWTPRQLLSLAAGDAGKRQKAVREQKAKIPPGEYLLWIDWPQLKALTGSGAQAIGLSTLEKPQEVQAVLQHGALASAGDAARSTSSTARIDRSKEGRKGATNPMRWEGRSRRALLPWPINSSVPALKKTARPHWSSACRWPPCRLARCVAPPCMLVCVHPRRVLHLGKAHKQHCPSVVRHHLLPSILTYCTRPLSPCCQPALDHLAQGPTERSADDDLGGGQGKEGLSLPRKSAGANSSSFLFFLFLSPPTA